MSEYFITGATGTIGSEVVHALLAKKKSVIAAGRNTDSIDKLFKKQTKSVKFDYTDPSTFKAVDGKEAVFILGPPLDPNLYNVVSPFVDYLIKNGPKKVVYLSANGMETLNELPFHGLMEEKLKNSGLDWTVLRAGFFMQNFGNYERENIEQRNIVFSPAGDGKTGFVSSRDIGEAAANCLTQQHTKETFILTGPELVSYQDAAKLLTEVTGKNITYPNPDEQTYRHVLKESGAPDFIADYMVPIYGLIKDNKVNSLTSDLENLIGRKPEKLISVLKRDFK